MKETILIVDDQANIRTLLQDFLTHQGYHVVIFKPFQMRDLLARIRATLCLGSQTAKQLDLSVEYLQ